MRVLVSGASGLIGRRVCAELGARGDRVERLVRHPPRSADEILWDPAGGRFDAAAAEGADAVVHLAGESVAAGRWSTARKQAILDSRTRGTRLLCEGLGSLRQPPQVIVSASAVGFYGVSGDAVRSEESPSGSGFLAEVSRAWEEAAEPARRKGIRVVHPRIGMVLASDGGALAKMLPLFRLGLGGRAGDGRQWMSWVDIEDLVHAVLFMIDRSELAGPVNAASPHPVRNAEFTATLAAALGRPALFPAPAFALRFALGEMAEELLLGGTRVEPAVLVRRGFRFRYPDLEGSLRHVLRS